MNIENGKAMSTLENLILNSWKSISIKNATLSCLLMASIAWVEHENNLDITGIFTLVL